MLKGVCIKGGMQPEGNARKALAARKMYSGRLQVAFPCPRVHRLLYFETLPCIARS